MEELSDMYFNSVGHNATLLLNVPPNNQGTVDEAILKRVEEFGKNVKESFDENLAKAEGEPDCSLILYWQKQRGHL